LVLILVLVKFFVLFLLDESSGIATCGGIFRESKREFIGVFSAFLKVQTALVVEFYGVIHAMEKAQKMRLTISN